MNNESWYAAKLSDMDVVRICESDNFDVDYDKGRGMYRVTIFKDGHFWDEVWFDAYEEKEVTNKTKLIGWLLGEKYNNIDENSDNMTEEFERQHQWELSRNYLINKTIKYIEQMT